MLNLLFSDFFREGALGVTTAGGGHRIFGHGEPAVEVRFTDRLAEWQLLLNPELKLGELYADGRMVLEKGDIAQLLDLLMRNLALGRPRGFHRMVRSWRRLTRRLAQFNPVSRAKAHVAHHYDLSGRLYDLFLDRDRQYSCAYFSHSGESLEDAQIGKKRHIAAKLLLDRPGLKVLDVGSGWGGLALDLARDAHAEVLGITLSEEQISVARQRAETARLADRCRFELVDYRKLTGRYDRIVSVGMFEHVGVPYYDTFFGKVRDLLADDGVMLLHTIGRSDGPGSTNSWIAKYIFPGGYVPALSEVAAAIERNGLIVTDVEVLRLHYAETLREWRRRFAANRAEAARIYDERFCRIWEFYLAGSEMAFRHDGEVVFQLQIARRPDAVPLTRDYMLEAERAMKFAGTETMPRPLRVV
ncbi:MAG TPA: cyclopropane-fatty-acyl-phospholipid synthase family protein [Rhizomicrobium sp.]|nr:cyclopropane-fatty-acyl-phospholipid synthase family protein [Rhizomicrobium sp.]